MSPRIKAMSGVILQALSATQQDVLVDLWQVDFREFGGEVFYYCGQVNELNKPVVWQGRAYKSLPIKTEGSETTSQGTDNRPTLTVSNIAGFVTAAAEQFSQMTGVTIIRRQTYAKSLDAVNFQSGKNPTADTTQEVVSKYLVKRLSTLTAETATLELAAPSGSNGAVVPARIILANICCWKYRGEGCGYMGRAVADRFDIPTDDSKKDICSGTLTGCRARFDATAVLPFGGFPSSDKVNT